MERKLVYSITGGLSRTSLCFLVPHAKVRAKPGAVICKSTPTFLHAFAIKLNSNNSTDHCF